MLFKDLKKIIVEVDEATTPVQPTTEEPAQPADGQKPTPAVEKISADERLKKIEIIVSEFKTILEKSLRASFNNNFKEVKQVDSTLIFEFVNKIPADTILQFIWAKLKNYKLQTQNTDIDDKKTVIAFS